MSHGVNSSLGSIGEVEYSHHMGVAARGGAGFVHAEYSHLLLIGIVAGCALGVSSLCMCRRSRRNDKIHPEGLGIMPDGLEEGHLPVPYVLRPAASQRASLGGASINWAW